MRRKKPFSATPFDQLNVILQSIPNHFSIIPHFLQLSHDHAHVFFVRSLGPCPGRVIFTWSLPKNRCPPFVPGSSLNPLRSNHAINSFTVTSFGIGILSRGSHPALNKSRKWRHTWARRWARTVAPAAAGRMGRAAPARLKHEFNPSRARGLVLHSPHSFEPRAQAIDAVRHLGGNKNLGATADSRLNSA